MSLGLSTTKKAADMMIDNGHRPFTVHVAGSNGKGTLCATLTAALGIIGTQTLMFSSPHLTRIEERFRINGTPIDSTALDNALSVVQTVDESMGGVLTFFESTFLAALHIARQERVKILVLETGLGGRLDATRCAPADVAVVTALTLEHTDVLGHTLEAIAHEKAGIARPGRPLIVRTPPEISVRECIVTAAAHAGQRAVGERPMPARLEWVDIAERTTYTQEALTLCKAIWPHLPLDGEPMPVIHELQWTARMQTVASSDPTKPTWLLEGAHNPSGMAKATQELKQQPFLTESWVLLFGSTPQQDLHTMVEPLVQLMTTSPPLEVVVSEPQGGRYPAVPSEVWSDVLEPLVTCPVTCLPLPADAVAYCQRKYGSSTTVLSIGSLYMQGNILEALGIATNQDLSVRAKA